MMDFQPNGYDLPWSVHGAIFAYGIGLVDNALLQPLAEACAEEGPLRVHADRQPAARSGRHRLPGQPHRPVLDFTSPGNSDGHPHANCRL